jgi:hypothetical protein
MTTTELLALLPNWYAPHTNEDTVYNTEWNDYDWDDYAIEITDEWYEVRHTGAIVELSTVEEVIEYITQ